MQLHFNCFLTSNRRQNVAKHTRLLTNKWMLHQGAVMSVSFTQWTINCALPLLPADALCTSHVTHLICVEHHCYETLEELSFSMQASCLNVLLNSLLRYFCHSVMMHVQRANHLSAAVVTLLPRFKVTSEKPLCLFPSKDQIPCTWKACRILVLIGCK